MRIHLFPFDKVNKGADVVICGLGTLGKEYVAEVAALDWCNIKAIIDKNREINEYKTVPVFLPEDYHFRGKAQYVIAVYSDQSYLEIREKLIQKGVDNDSIIWSNKICSITDCDADIVKPLDIRKNGVEKLNEIFIKKGFYISGIPFYFQNKEDIDYVKIYKNFVKTNTVDNALDQTRVWFLTENLESVLSCVSGDVAELGVYQGATAELLLQHCVQNDRTLFLFDTFDGFSEKDIMGVDGGQDSKAFSDTDESSVIKRLGSSRWLKIKKGYFPESTDDESKNNKYAFVHIDCDLYKPIYAGLSFFWPRMSTGGMVVVHDYSSGFWEGATNAVNQFCNENSISKVLIPDWSGSVVIIKE